MDILYRKKTIKTITNSTEFEKFLLENNIFVYFRKFQDIHIELINNSINSTEKLNYKQIKPFLRKIINYPESVLDRQFLFAMGWEESDVIEFIKQKQSSNSKYYSKIKQLSPEKYYEKSSTRIEYWLKKGFDPDSAKIKLSERQSTFSRKKCIDLYGETIGNKKFEERQQRWLNSLLKSEKYSGKNKNCYKYATSSYRDLIIRTTFLQRTKDVLLSGLTYSNKEEFVNFVTDNIEIKTNADILPYINSRIIQNYFNCSSIDLRNIFLEKTPELLNSNNYGFSIYHNGVRFKSIGEYKIALFLEEMGVDFIYEKNYPNSKFKFDFYLPQYDIYVEYFGLLDRKKIKSYNNIHIQYFNKMNTKINYCIDNELRLIYSINCDVLINELKLIINENND